MFTSDLGKTAVKMVCMDLKFRGQRHKKVFQHITAKNGMNTILFCIQAHAKAFLFYGGNFLKRILTYLNFTKYNENNICHSNVQKLLSYEKGNKLYKYFVYRLRQRFSDTLQPMGGFLKRILTHLYCTKYDEIDICHSDVQKYISYKTCIDIHIQDHTKNF